MNPLKISINGNHLDTDHDKMVFKYEEKMKDYPGGKRPVFVYQNNDGIYFLTKQNGNYCKILSKEEFQILKDNRTGGRK